jgi:hypothetical protein
MTWCRNNNIDVDDEDDSPENFKKLANIPLPKLGAVCAIPRDGKPGDGKPGDALEPETEWT